MLGENSSDFFENVFAPEQADPSLKYPFHALAGVSGWSDESLSEELQSKTTRSITSLIVGIPAGSVIFPLQGFGQFVLAHSGIQKSLVN